MSEVRYIQTDAVPRSRADTGIKASTGSFVFRGKTMKIDVDEAVQKELSSCQLADTDEFLKKILPVDEDLVSQIYNKLVAGGHYDEQTKQWQNLPRIPKEEASMYGPFANLANAIRVASTIPFYCSNLGQRCNWYDRHEQQPKSRDENAPAIRPDLVCALGDEKEMSNWATMAENRKSDATVSYPRIS
jgi:hypothetical protein